MKKITSVILIIATVLAMGICPVNADMWTVVDKNNVAQKEGYKVGAYYFLLDENYDTNDKVGLKYSIDGLEFAYVEGVRTNSIPKYSNGFYFVIDTLMENVPINKRYVGFNNAPSYILDGQLNILNTIEDKCYINYLGYYNGYHYLDFTYYVSNSQQNNWESKESGHLYKTNNGSELVPVDIEKEDVSFIGGICLNDNSIVKESYGRDDKLRTNLFLKNKKYNILYEKKDFLGFNYINTTIPLLYMTYKIGEKTVDWLDDRQMNESILKKYVTIDGIYGVEMPEDIGQYRFEIDNNLYFEKDESTYYCISKSEMSDKIKIIYKDGILAFETAPTMEADRTLVPMRFLFEQMGANVDWEGETQTATVEKGNDKIAFSINNTAAKVNNTIKTMDVPARLINSKTMIPLRFLSEELGYNVEWDQNTKTVTISD